MKDEVPEIVEQHRITKGIASTTEEYGFCGAFVLPGGVFGLTFSSIRCIVDDGTGKVLGEAGTWEEVEEMKTGWEHVSVCQLQGDKPKTPSWEIMAKVKRLFWKETERVVQYHPPEDEYVNCHPHVLHLWRPINENVPAPPPKLVGPMQ
jgi:hypothetical protein